MPKYFSPVTVLLVTLLAIVGVAELSLTPAP